MNKEQNLFYLHGYIKNIDGIFYFIDDEYNKTYRILQGFISEGPFSLLIRKYEFKKKTISKTYFIPGSQRREVIVFEKMDKVKSFEIRLRNI